MKFKKNKKNKASVLVVSLIIVSIVLIASLSIALVASRERRASIGTSKSVTVFQSADQIVEQVLQEIQWGDHRTINDLDNGLNLSIGSLCTVSGTGYFQASGTNDETYKIGLLDFNATDNTYNLIDCRSNRDESIGIIKRIEVTSITSQAGRAIEANVDCNIRTCAQLQAIPSSAEGYYCLANNINCSASPFSRSPIQDFKGHFDGKGFIISDLTITSDEDNVGIFSEISRGSESSAMIENLGVENPQISGTKDTSSVGVLAGSASDVNIENCYVIGGEVNGEGIVGGLVGEIGQTTAVIIAYSYSTSKVSGKKEVGGLVGKSSSNDDMISQCYYGGEVSSEDEVIGGLVGLNKGKVQYSYYDSTKNPYPPVFPCGSGTGSCPADSAKETDDMKKESTYGDDWYFYDILDGYWQIKEGESYPCFLWQLECPKP